VTYNNGDNHKLIATVMPSTVYIFRMTVTQPHLPSLNPAARPAARRWLPINWIMATSMKADVLSCLAFVMFYGEFTLFL